MNLVRQKKLTERLQDFLHIVQVFFWTVLFSGFSLTREYYFDNAHLNYYFSILTLAYKSLYFNKE
jgi:hypothetical protein